jgi:hypothetical protein
MFFLTLFIIYSFIHVTQQQQTYQVTFQKSSFGTEFQCNNCTNLSPAQVNASSMLRCALSCCKDARCQTFDYDIVFSKCRLFSVWVYQGTMIASASSTSRVGFIKQAAVLYALYQQTCNIASDINRYLVCNNTVWSCPTGQVYNGSICQQQQGNNITAYYR